MHCDLANRFWRRVAALILVLASTAAFGAASLRAEPPTDRLLVRFKSVSTLPRAASVQVVPGRDRVQSLAIRRATPLKYVRTMYNGTHTVHLGRMVQGAELDAIVRKLAADPEVALVVPDRIKRVQATVPNDPRFGTNGSVTEGQFTNQWYLLAPDSTLISPINAAAAWDYSRGAANIRVAVVDTGVLFRHPDLGTVANGGKLLPGYDMIGPDNTSNPPTYAVANDGNGADPDPTDPGDWINTADQSNPVFSGVTGGCPISPSSWHGTKVAGVIGAATNDGIGISGVAWDSPVLPMRALGKCIGYDSDIIDAMAWAAGVNINGYICGGGNPAQTPTICPDTSSPYSPFPVNPYPARIINLSLGSQTSCSPVYQEIVNFLTAPPYNVVIVAAAGNSGATTTNPTLVGNGGVVTEPANCPGVIAVEALRHAGSKVGFSNFGPEVAISAPGGNCVSSAPPCYYSIVSTGNSGTETATDAGMNYIDGNQASFMYSGQTIGGGGEFGTSFSAPMVSGVVALMLAVNPNLTPHQVLVLLQTSARPFPGIPSGSTVPACPATVDPVNGAAECYCPAPATAANAMTMTAASGGVCGAGMLDALGAVLAAYAAAGVSSPPILPAPAAVSPPVIPPLQATTSNSGGGGGGTAPWWILPVLAASLMRVRIARTPGSSAATRRLRFCAGRAGRT